MHAGVRRLVLLLALGACNPGDGRQPPSSDWSWQCPDETPAPDAGCPLDPRGDDAGSGDDAGGGDGDAGAP